MQIQNISQSIILSANDHQNNEKIDESRTTPFQQYRRYIFTYTIYIH